MLVKEMLNMCYIERVRWIRILMQAIIPNLIFRNLLDRYLEHKKERIL